MSHLVAFPDPRKAREEASLWLARLDRGLTDEERSSLRTWLQEPVNHKGFLELGRLWRGLDVINALAELFPLSPELLNPKPRRSFSRIVLTAAAAGCIAAVGTFMLTGGSPLSLLDSSRASPLAVYNETWSTGIGESRVAELADGSTITLNTATRIVVFYSPRSRDVYLSYGEANFDVVRETSRPFNVHAGKRVLQAGGTSFNVRMLTADNVELSVSHGKVKLLYVPPRLPESPARLREEIMHGEITIGALESAFIEPAAQSVRKLAPDEAEARLAWQRGMMIFQGEPLERVLSEVGRYTTTKFALADESLREVRVGGYFHTGDVEGVLRALRENFLIDSRSDGQGRIVLTALPHP